jgi:hypothetical protein
MKNNQLIETNFYLGETGAISAKPDFQQLYTDNLKDIIVASSHKVYSPEATQIYDHAHFPADIRDRIVDNLWFQKKYLDLYVRFLLGSIDETQFDRESEHFTRDYDHLPEDEIATGCAYLSTLRPAVSVDEVAEILNIPPFSLGRLKA